MMLKWMWAVLFVAALAIVVASILCLFEEEHTDKQLVRSPVDNSLLMVEKPMTKDNWYFKHCTPTNKECGRLQ